MKAGAFSPLAGSSPKPWLERAFGECAWPVGGEGADTISCCLPAMLGRPYCPAHWELRTGEGTRTEREILTKLGRAA